LHIVARDISQETDVPLLQQAVRLLEHENRRLVQEIATLTRELAELHKSANPDQAVQLRLEAIEQHLAKLQKMLYGPTSERNKPSDSDDKEKQTEKRKQTGHPRRKQEQLPLVIRRHEVPEAERICEVCGKPLLDWKGQHESSREVHILQRAFIMVEHQQQKMRCPDGCSVVTAPTPRKLFRGARYSIEFALEVAIEKYLYHMPLARQVRQMRSEGLIVDTQTLWDQLDKLSLVLFPLYKRILEFVFSHPVVGADETTWRMLNKEEQKKHGTNKTWQVWTLAVPSAAYYEIKDSRSLGAATELLGDFKGTILCDGYDVYPALARSTADKVLAFCWAHARRKYKDIEAFFPKETEGILKLIDKLFEIDRRAEGDTPEALSERTRLRNECSHPIVDEIKKWAIEVQTMPGNALAKAIEYMANHWSGLVRFLDDPRIALSNNISERANRDPVLGRKNHYGSRSLRGTEVAAQLYTILETAKLSDVDARAYLQIAVDAALDGIVIPLPHECRDATVARTAENIKAATEHLTTDA
jgi:transposase